MARSSPNERKAKHTDLAWLFFPKPEVDPNAPLSRRPGKPMVSDWVWAAQIAVIAAITAYCVHTGADRDYPAGRAPVYFWIALGTIFLAPALVLRYFIGPRRAQAVYAALWATLFSGGMLFLCSWPESEQVIFDPLRTKTWSDIEARIKPGVAVWLVITALIAVGAWLAAWVACTENRPGLGQPKGKRGRQRIARFRQ